jgi:2-polyprenyl-3-methyl-5-hydroxy-6-metoxy-1,4-benzoquinol methylase
MTPMQNENRFPDWKQIYENTDVREMPWYQPLLDHDLDQALKSRKITHGKFLDIGTGPATQALELAKRGFEVTGTDLAPKAIGLAQEKAAQAGIKATFLVDDILNSKVTGLFDAAFDRGCFHVLSPEMRAKYVKTVRGFLRDGQP